VQTIIDQESYSLPSSASKLQLTDRLKHSVIGAHILQRAEVAVAMAGRLLASLYTTAPALVRTPGAGQCAGMLRGCYVNHLLMHT